MAVQWAENNEGFAPMIFAAKTTAAGLLALLIAFTFNLDQPQWALLTVFIVSQPELSGSVLAKSFYRTIGTAIGAAIALLLVALFAQERVLFLGALALWIGSCTFGSQYARNFGAYSFVLSGYTAAIVGIPARNNCHKITAMTMPAAAHSIHAGKKEPRIFCAGEAVQPARNMAASWCTAMFTRSRFNRVFPPICLRAKGSGRGASYATHSLLSIS